MDYTLNKIPLFQHLEESENILLAGAGGGFDIYARLPIYFNLIEQGIKSNNCQFLIYLAG